MKEMGGANDIWEIKLSLWGKTKSAFNTCIMKRRLYFEHVGHPTKIQTRSKEDPDGR